MFSFICSRINTQKVDMGASWTYCALRWSWWIFPWTLLTQAGHSPGLLNFGVEHSEDEHHRQTLGKMIRQM